MIISMTDPILEGNPGASGVGPFTPFVPPDVNYGPIVDHRGPRPNPIDSDFGDMKMAARTDDHFEGSMQWLLCDGRALNRLAYAQLFAIIGIAYGPGDGVNTFNIPRFTLDPLPGTELGRFPVYGAPGAAGGTGRHNHTIATNAVPPFGHALGISTSVGTNLSNLQVDAGGSATDTLGLGHTHGSAGLNVFHAPDPITTDPPAVEAVNPYVAVGFFIRAT